MTRDRTDLALAVLDGSDVAIDLVMAAGDLVTDEGLRTALLVSLLTDRRADPDDPLPLGETDRRGWAGDLLEREQDDWIGSKLWLLFPGKRTEATRLKIEAAAREAIGWVERDRVARIVTCIAVFEEQAVRISVAVRRLTSGAVVAVEHVWRPAA